MPSIFMFMGYKIYFWMNEVGEPIHVHVCKGKPSRQATKIWITRMGKCLVAVNSSRIPKHDLALIMSFIESNIAEVYSKWQSIHGTPKFYC